MPTETIQTRHGDVEVQTATCDSCGQSMLEEDALPFYIQTPDRWTVSGAACEHCATEGPASFPQQEVEQHDWGITIDTLYKTVVTMVLSPFLAVWLHALDDHGAGDDVLDAIVLGTSIWAFSLIMVVGSV